MIGTLAFAAACATNPRPRTGVEYVVRQPPAERVEVIPAAPGAGYAWVKGRWEHDRKGWFYVEGHWR